MAQVTRIYMKDADDLPAKLFRRKAFKTWDNNKDKPEFVRQYKTALHWLYSNSTFWLNHDLLLKSNAYRNRVNFKEHWNIAQQVDDAITACEKRHEVAGTSESMDAITEEGIFLIEVSRDSYKSTYVRAGLIRVMAIHPEWTNGYARAEFDDASKGLVFIADHLEFNEELHSYFPHLKINSSELKKKRMKSNRKAIKLPNVSALQGAEDDDEPQPYAVIREYKTEATLEAVGLGTGVTGRHYSGLFVMDDPVTEKNWQSIPQQETLYGRFAEIVGNIKESTCVIVWPQTRYGENDLFMKAVRLCQQLQAEEDVISDKFGKKHVKVFRHYQKPLLELEGYDAKQLLQFVISPKNTKELELGKAAIVFPERHSPRDIRQKYKILGPMFYSQYLLMLMSDIGAVYNPEWLVFYGPNTPFTDPPRRQDFVHLYGIVDPSGGKGATHDEVGILIAGDDKYGVIWFMLAIERRFSDKELMDFLIGVDQIYHPDTWHWESYAAENKYRSLLNQMIVASGHRIVFQRMKGGNSAGEKSSRIAGGTTPFEFGKVRIRHDMTDFIEPYKKWKIPCPPGVPDNLLDCWGYLNKMIYPKADQVRQSDQQSQNNLSGISALAQKQIEYLRKERKRDMRGVFATCILCGKKNVAWEQACLACGGELTIPLHNISVGMEMCS